MEKRKTRTSSEVKNRYNAKHYKRYQASIKPELADSIEEYIIKNNLNKAKFLELAFEALKKQELQADHTDEEP